MGFDNFINTKFWQGGHCYSIVTNFNKQFLYQLIKFHERSIMGLRVGSGLPNIHRSRLNGFELFLPEDKDEHRKIAEVLTEVDNKIQSLEQTLTKNQLLKHGMKQELLTGKTRLV